MALKNVEEGKTIIIRLSYKDIAKAAIIPSTIRYKLHDLDSDTELISWTNVNTPAASNDITIPDEANRFHSSTKSIETRVFTSEAVFSNGTVIPKEIRYTITNLRYYAPPA